MQSIKFVIEILISQTLKTFLVNLYKPIFYLAVQCERKPAALGITAFKDGLGLKNKTVGLDYLTSSEESEEEKSNNLISKQLKEQVTRGGLFQCTEQEANPNNSISNEKVSNVSAFRRTNSPNNNIHQINETIEEKLACEVSYQNPNSNDSSEINFSAQNMTKKDEEGRPIERFKNSDVQNKVEFPYLTLKNRRIKDFCIEAPSIPTTDVGYLYEISTRLLFVTIDWVQCLAAFRKLNKVDQLNLLIDKWYSLFILGMAQCSSMFPISTLLFLANNNQDGIKSVLNWETFTKLKEVILNGNLNLKTSKDIYDYMKIITLFDSGNL